MGNKIEAIPRANESKSNEKDGGQLELHDVIPQPVNVDSYPRNHPAQKVFDKNLETFVVMDCQPFSVASGIGFQTMIHRFDRRIHIPHPTTIERRTNVSFQKVNSLFFGMYYVLYILYEL